MPNLVRAVDSQEAVSNRFALFDYGFRPFFLLAGLYAAAIVPIWLYLHVHHAATFGALPAMYWHSHEMLFGFVCAAIAGFLLTAVPSWNNMRGFAGLPLMGLVAVWLGGRIAMATVGNAPFWLMAAVELAFVPSLAALVAPALIRNANRNTPLLGVLAALWIIDALFLVALKGGDAALATRAISLAIDFVLVLVTVISGRIVPSFTANALRRRGDTANIVSHDWLEKTLVGLMIAVAIVDVFAPTALWSGLLAVLAAAAHSYRLSGWLSFKTRGEPILWVLHLAYAWLPIGFVLKACWLLGGLEFAMKWQHALAAGVFATMILAVMTRVSLGHTGRPLVVRSAITGTYLLLTLSILGRVFGGSLWPHHYVLAISVAGIAWMSSFLIYLAFYVRILVRPRADGKPG
ncbi:MAG TPA: NnrS family protein [Steroidobacteraceae bacterium]|nr:NnrS family protein [Steroidobacteraceae bacterium]